MAIEAGPVQLHSSEQFILENAKGDEYLIQISWPIQWQDRMPSSTDPKAVPVIYLTDGNAHFLTATETAWRRMFDPHYAGGGLVVAIGYPLTDSVLDIERRRHDLTMPKRTVDPQYGGANDFLVFIDKTVRPTIKSRFPHVSFSREALYGHSLGGLFVLHSLFSREQLFDCYVASSPSVWYDDCSLMDKAKQYLGKPASSERSLRSVVLLSVGAEEQTPVRWAKESEESWENRNKDANEWNMGKNSLEMFKLLDGCKQLQTVRYKVYEGEEHGSVMACAVNRALIEFFEDWDSFVGS